MSNHVNEKDAKCKSIIEASQLQKKARHTISIYININIAFRGKLYNSKPIMDLKETFKLVNFKLKLWYLMIWNLTELKKFDMLKH